MFRFVDHQADIAVEVAADSREELFTEALRALIVLLTRRDVANEAAEGEPLALRAHGTDDEERLVGLLGELLFACQTEGWGPLTVTDVQFEEDAVGAEIRAVQAGGGMLLHREIKAVTYHNLQIQHDAETIPPSTEGGNRRRVGSGTSHGRNPPLPPPSTEGGEVAFPPTGEWRVKIVFDV